jgi:hypothetical protein
MGLKKQRAAATLPLLAAAPALFPPEPDAARPHQRAQARAQAVRATQWPAAGTPTLEIPSWPHQCWCAAAEAHLTVSALPDPKQAVAHCWLRRPTSSRGTGEQRVDGTLRREEEEQTRDTGHGRRSLRL